MTLYQSLCEFRDRIEKHGAHFQSQHWATKKWSSVPKNSPEHKMRMKQLNAQIAKQGAKNVQ